ncbi:RING/FYVE/PHD zinc finger superfamily protein [Hibiscus syriacus]|uniref:RING/FYVE/PHD zinc finger superfamily protein n=1 Tax=Hibiscus syriacus TaxID=106335 RepID=A0A6A3AJX9_HIBSY|nr:RING/FYVE/PHD zinc finger superfamily protein [Hibiscus syriacus]
MADIALLVAEEYERRLGISRHQTGAGKQQRLPTPFPCSGVGFEAEGRIEVSKLGIEPKTQIGVAALHGALSA